MHKRLVNGEGWKVHVEHIQDVDPILDENKRKQNLEQRGWVRQVGSIPHVVTVKWMQEDGVFWPRLAPREQDEYLRRKLNDPDYLYLKTTSLKV